MRRLLLLVAFLIPTLSTAENYGDFVAQCLAKKGVQPDTPEFRNALPYCEMWATGAKQLADAQTASEKLMSCLLEKAAIFDDGVSQASDVSKVIVAGCDLQVLEYARKLDPDLEAVSSARRAQITDVPALTAVLSVRADKRKRQEAQVTSKPKQ